MKSEVKEQENKALNINIIYFQDEDLETLLESEEFISFITKESYKRVLKALEENLDTIELFTISNLLLSVEINKKHYKSILETNIKYYTEIEDYKKCSEIQKIIKKYEL